MRWLVLGGTGLYLFALAAAIPALWTRASVRRDHGWRYLQQGKHPRVTEVSAGGPADGLLQVGDRILSIDGETRYGGFYAPNWQIWEYAPGREYRVRLMRNSELRDVTLRIGFRADSSDVPIIATFLFGSLTFTGIAVLMGWQRPGLRTARIGWLASQLTGLVYVNLALGVTQSLLWRPTRELSLLRLIGDWHIWVVWCFVAEFPYPPPPSLFWRRVRLGLAALCALSWILTAGWNVPFAGQLAWPATCPNGGCPLPTSRKAGSKLVWR